MTAAKTRAIAKAQSDVARPSLGLLSTEPWRAAAEFVSHKIANRSIQAVGDGHPVVIFPGLGSNGLAVAPLREHCQRLGYAAFDWGRGRNTGPGNDVDAWLQALADEVAQRLQGHALPPTLIGWSLGGIYARELAKLPSLRVRQVITIGTPFNGTPEQTHAGWVYHLLNGERASVSPAMLRRIATPPPVPTTSLYSRSDGVVAWQACTHTLTGPQLQDIEIEGSHLGMGWNPRVLRVVGDRLAQPVGQWRQYQPLQ